MKNFIKKIKEFKKDPKKRSLYLLIVYGIFFIIVFIYIKSGQPSNTPIKYDNNSQTANENIENSQNKKEISNYEYTYEINKDNNLLKISGTYYDNKDNFKLDSEDYNIKDYYIYSNTTNELIVEFPISRLSYNEIEKLLNNFDYNSKTEYKDGNISYEYIINNKDYKTFINDSNDIDGNIKIIVNKKDYIEKLEIDLSEYYNIENYKIIINYANINNILKVENN